MKKYIQTITSGTLAVAVLLGLGVGVLGSPLRTNASSHREAPLISADPQADITDVFAFVSPDRSDSVTLIASFNPFEAPAGGPNFHSFGDDVLYQIHVDSNGDAVEDITYQFTFATTVQNPGTFLYNTGPIDSLTDSDFNVRQTYTLTKVEAGQSTVLGTNLPVPPVNVGPKSIPDYAAVSNSAIREVGNGMRVFAGQTDDPFFVELGGIFDLLTIRKLPGNAGGGVDGLAGYNVHSVALQVPIDQLTKTKTRVTDPKADGAVVGVWATTSRRATKVLSTGSPSSSGDWVQVARLGAPLVNEVVIPRGQKDAFNASKPANDGQFANYVTDPELAKLFKGLYGINVPPQAPFGQPNGRDDLVAVFLTGIKDLTQPTGVKPSEQLRLNVAIAPTSNPNALGVVGGDVQGYPNGRRLADDVTDISLKAVAGAVYPLFHPEFTADATGVQLGDGVDRNDKSFRGSFPYLALAHNGLDSRPQGQVIAGDMPTPTPVPQPGQPIFRVFINQTLVAGSRGDIVSTLQRFLTNAGPDVYPQRLITGRFGPLTRAAVIRFQAKVGLPVSGRVDQRTLDVINSLASQDPKFLGQ